MTCFSPSARFSWAPSEARSFVADSPTKESDNELDLAGDREEPHTEAAVPDLTKAVKDASRHSPV
jgi:hypothetical protein